MYYEKEEINASLIETVVFGIRKRWEEEERNALLKIQTDKLEGRKVPSDAVEKNKQKYLKFRQNDPILILGKKVEELERECKLKKDLDKLGFLIKEVNDKSASKLINKEQYKHIEKGNVIKSEADKIFNDPEINIKRPTDSRSVNEYDFLKWVDKDENGFNISSDYLGYSGIDAYRELFEQAINNQMNSLYRSASYKKEINSNIYVKNERQELDQVKEFWESKDFKEYKEQLRREDPKKYDKYRKAEIKKEKAIEKLSKSYEEIGEKADSIEKIHMALRELQIQEANIPKKTYIKISKALNAQKNKYEKQKQKLEKENDKIYNKTGLRISIDNAKAYKREFDNLESLRSDEFVKEELDNLKIQLNLAEADLNKEYEKSEVMHEEKEIELKNGDAYETGEIKPSSRTNMQAINEAQNRVQEIKGKMFEINNNDISRKRETIKGKIFAIAKREVDTTIIMPDLASQTVLPSGTVIEQEQKNWKKELEFKELDHNKALKAVEENMISKEEKIK